MTPSDNTDPKLETRVRLHKIICLAMGVDDEDHNETEEAVMVEEAILELFQADRESAGREAVDEKLATLVEVVPYLELCEADADRILTWAKNHRWSLIAPPGENTQAPDSQLTKGSSDDLL